MERLKFLFKPDYVCLRPKTTISFFFPDNILFKMKVHNNVSQFIIIKPKCFVFHYCVADRSFIIGEKGEIIEMIKCFFSAGNTCGLPKINNVMKNLTLNEGDTAK